MVKRNVFILVSLVFFLLGGMTLFFYVKGILATLPEPDYHEHADIALFLNGEMFDFSKPEFMSNKPCSLDEAKGIIPVAYAHGGDLEDSVHLHDLDGAVVHLHRPNISVHDFFESLKMDFEDTIFIDHEGNQYRNNEESNFRFFVNNNEEPSIMNRELRDLDRVLITYGPRDRAQASIDAELVQVSQRACVQSGSCLHRGTPPPESCGKVYHAPKILDWLGFEVELH